MKTRHLLTAALFGLPGAALAQRPAQAGTAQGDLGITIYSDMALVEDVRSITLPAGVSRQEFPDVSAMIRPETVTFGSSGLDVVEQNFDFDLISPDSMMRKAEGQGITLLRTNPATGAQIREPAKVLAVNGGVVLETGGHIEILRDDGLPVRVLFDRIPPNLRVRPTLSVMIEAERGGTQPVTLSYLTGGLGWQADYVGLFDEGKGRMDLQGWVTLTNTTGTSFHNAKLVLAAGDLMKLQQGRPSPGQGYAYSRANGDNDSDEKPVGDLYLYPVDARTTVATNQKKQVSFLDASGVPASRGYRFDCGWSCSRSEAIPALSILHFSTGKKGGLGHALPAGTMRVYMRDPSGKSRFVGESKIEHTAAGSDVDLPTALAFDVKVQPILDKRERITDSEWTDSARYRITASSGVTIVDVKQQREYWRNAMRYVVTNQRPQPIELELRQNGLQGWSQQTRVSEESQQGVQDGADTRVWKIEVPAKGKSELTVTYLTSF